MNYETKTARLPKYAFVDLDNFLTSLRSIDPNCIRTSDELQEKVLNEYPYLDGMIEDPDVLLSIYTRTCDIKREGSGLSELLIITYQSSPSSFGCNTSNNYLFNRFEQELQNFKNNLIVRNPNLFHPNRNAIPQAFATQKFLAKNAFLWKCQGHVSSNDFIIFAKRDARNFAQVKILYAAQKNTDAVDHLKVTVEIIYRNGRPSHYSKITTELTYGSKTSLLALLTKITEVDWDEFEPLELTEGTPTDVLMDVTTTVAGCGIKLIQAFETELEKEEPNGEFLKNLLSKMANLLPIISSSPIEEEIRLKLDEYCFLGGIPCGAPFDPSPGRFQPVVLPSMTYGMQPNMGSTPIDPRTGYPLQPSYARSGPTATGFDYGPARM